MEDYKLLPYGISNYVQIRRDNRYWVDKSMYPDIRHSYIIELKYLPMTATTADAENSGGRPNHRSVAMPKVPLCVR